MDPWPSPYQRPMFDLDDMARALDEGAAVVVALLQPGFSMDLSTWMIRVDEDGESTRFLFESPLDRDLSIDGEGFARPEPYFGHEKLIVETTSTSASLISEAREAIEAAGFLGNTRRLEPTQWDVTDQATTALGARIGDRRGLIQYYGAGFVAEFEGCAVAREFCRIWGQIAGIFDDR